uniref:Homeobox domain-containing protein n=1 Tax=Ditylenchus dipsaci TaxID=166011 RepID=A0A915EC65_9BILA
MTASSGQALFSISSLLQTDNAKPSPKASIPAPTFLHQLNLLLNNSSAQLVEKARDLGTRHNSIANGLSPKVVLEHNPMKSVRRKSAEGALEDQFSKLGKEEDREDSISPSSASSKAVEGCSSPEVVIPALPNAQMNANQWYNYVAASMAAAATSQQQHQQMQLAAQVGGSAMSGVMPAASGWDLGRLQPWLYPYANPAGGPMHQHNHHKSQHKRKGGQIRFTNEQTDALENTFDNHKYLSNNQRKKLAKSLVLSERQVKTWFQNRRAKHRRNLPSDGSFSHASFPLDSLE